jgi:hypothetical protein
MLHLINDTLKKAKENNNRTNSSSCPIIDDTKIHDFETKMKDSMKIVKPYITTLPYEMNAGSRKKKQRKRSHKNRSHKKRSYKKEGEEGGMPDRNTGNASHGANDLPETTSVNISPDVPDRYDMIASILIMTMFGGIHYTGYFYILFDRIVESFAESGGYPTLHEACSPDNILMNNQIGRIVTGMVSCEDVQRTYTALTIFTAVSIIGVLGIMNGITFAVDSMYLNPETNTTSNNYMYFMNIASSMYTINHRNLAHMLRNSVRGAPPTGASQRDDNNPNLGNMNGGTKDSEQALKAMRLLNDACDTLEEIFKFMFPVSPSDKKKLNDIIKSVSQDCYSGDNYPTTKSRNYSPPPRVSMVSSLGGEIPTRKKRHTRKNMYTKRKKRKAYKKK